MLNIQVTDHSEEKTETTMTRDGDWQEFLGDFIALRKHCSIFNVDSEVFSSIMMECFPEQ